jgi:3D (Asp-Asp-Asp) domain-containing protein
LWILLWVGVLGKPSKHVFVPPSIECEWLEFEATAYTANCLGCSGITKSGVPADYTQNMLAADTRHYPIGTRFFWMGDWHVVMDTGGAIKGRNRVDVLVRDVSTARKWGRRNVRICVQFKGEP